MRLKTSDFGVFEKRLTDSRIGFCNTSALIPSGWLRCGVVNAASDDPGTHVLKVRRPERRLRVAIEPIPTSKAG
jgi:hypothetical protein